MIAASRLDPIWREKSWPNTRLHECNEPFLLRTLLASELGPVLLDDRPGSPIYEAVREAAHSGHGLCVLLTAADADLSRWPSHSMPTVVARNAPGSEIAAIVELKTKGYDVVAPKVSPPADGPPETLTGRELDVVERITRGASNKEIARDLSLSEHTVRVHVRNILRKLNLSNRTQAAIWFQRRAASRPFAPAGTLVPATA